MRILHTMIRVGNLDQSIAFYTEVLGMQLIRRQDYPDGRFTLAFVGYGDEASEAVLELTHNWDTPAYDLGNGFGHVALAVPAGSSARAPCTCAPPPALTPARYSKPPCAKRLAPCSPNASPCTPPASASRRRRCVCPRPGPAGAVAALAAALR